VNDFLDIDPAGHCTGEDDVPTIVPGPTPETNPAPPVLGRKLAPTACATPRLGSNGGALLLSVVIAGPPDVGEVDEEVVA